MSLFEVALSFAGEYRERVRTVAEEIAARLPDDARLFEDEPPTIEERQKRVLFDEFHEAHLAGVSRDIHLPKLFKQAELVVVFLCPEYKDKGWPMLEYRRIYDLIGNANPRTRERVMLLSFGPPGDVSELGLGRGDIWIDIADRTVDKVVDLILERLELNRRSDPPLPRFADQRVIPAPPRRPPTPLPLDHQYAVISEWLAPGWFWAPGRWLLTVPLRRRKVWPLGILGVLAAGAAATALAFHVDAACISATITNVNDATRRDWLLYGYVAELAHAGWALVGAALAVFFLGAFFKRSTMYLRRAERSGRLVVDGYAGAERPVVTWFADRNRRLFRILTPALLLGAAAVVGGAEAGSWNDRSFGWVQARAAASLQGEPLTALDVGPLPVEQRVCPMDRSACKVDRIQGGPRSTHTRRWFMVFVVVALLSQAIFVFVAFYAAAKVLFFVWVHLRAARVMRDPMRDGTLKLRLDYGDGADRLGLGPLDEPLRAALNLALLACVYFCLVSLSNNEKGSRFILDGFGTNLAHFSHLLGFIIVVALWLAGFLFPLLLLDHLCYDAVADQRARLTSSNALKRLERQRARPRLTIAIPAGFALFLCIIIPIGLWLGSDFPPIERVRQFMTRTVPAAVCKLSGNVPGETGETR